MKYIRYILLLILKPFLLISGRLHMPYSRPYIFFETIAEDLIALEVGDVILSKTAGEFANFLTPFGKWKHSAIFLGDGIVLESNQHGVIETNIIDFCVQKKHIAVVRPNCKILSDKLIHFGEKQLGKKYDYSLLVGANKYYCSELVFDVLKNGSLDFTFKQRKIWGENTITPDDFYNAKKHFTRKWEI